MSGVKITDEQQQQQQQQQQEIPLVIEKGEKRQMEGVYHHRGRG
jgi:hypothetical protein